MMSETDQIGQIRHGVCPVHGQTTNTDHLGFSFGRKEHICMTCVWDEMERLKAKLAERDKKIEFEQEERDAAVLLLTEATKGADEVNAELARLRAEIERLRGKNQRFKDQLE